MTNITGKIAQAIEHKVAEEMEQDVLTVGFKRLTEDAVIPTKAHVTDSGFDLVANEDVIIEPGETAVVPTGIAVQLPPGYEAQVRPRSGVTAKTKLRIQLGTIDNEFTGNIGVIVDNIANRLENSGTTPRLRNLKGKTEFLNSTFDHSYFEKQSYIIRKGDRIAQLVVQQLPEVQAVEITEIGTSNRGDKGFGSTGVDTKGER